MVEQQVRTWDVLDQAVLDLLFTVKREHFVPSAYRALAFADVEIPLGDGEYMWTPKMEARVVQELELQRDESTLEIGTGSGYLTALLARRGSRYRCRFPRSTRRVGVRVPARPGPPS